MEIYRPPNVRTDTGKLNVHAKEFTMTHDLQTSKSSGNLAHLLNYESVPLQQSKSSGNILRHIHAHPLIPLLPTMPVPLMHSSSTTLIHNVPHRVNFQMPSELLQQQQQQQSVYGNHMNYNWNKNILKRSKSMTAAEQQTQALSKLKGFSKEEIDIGSFPAEEQENLKTALLDPNQLQSRTLMDMVKIILERVVEGIRYSEAGAKLCITIIEKEKTQTFLESLINTCQQWYQERDKILRGIKAGDGTRFTAFMWFLTEMCGQLKRHQLKTQFESLQPDLVLLSVLAKCCQACVSLPINCLAETECLFFVLTSIGRDLESELPAQLEQLLASVRDGFLASAGSPSVRRTLLQLIELHASNWQLPGSSVLYYYPRIK